MRIETTPIEGVLLAHPAKHGDERGFFSETFRASAWRDAGVAHDWVQDNHSYSAAVGTLRGMHFQRPPHAQAKLVRVTRGAVLDVVVDLRAGSPTYGKHFAAELSAANWTQLYVPPGFAHGFITLAPDTEFLYRVSANYAPDAEGGIAWDDPDLGIAWPAGEKTVNDRDKNWPRLRDFTSPF